MTRVSAPPPVLRVISPEGAAEPLAAPMTRALVGLWFGPQAAKAETVVRGLAGLVAARVGTGPSRADSDAWVQARMADRTLQSLFTDSAPEPEDELAPLRRRAAGPGWHLAVLDEQNGPKLLELDGRRLVLGRDPAADVVIDDANVSRRHATIACEGERVEVRDEGSRNGTRVNGRKVLTSELHDGDRIGIGNWDLVVLRVGPEPVAAQACLQQALVEADHALEELLRAQHLGEQRHLAAHRIPAGEPRLPRTIVQRCDHDAPATLQRHVVVLESFDVEAGWDIDLARRHLHDVHPAVRQVAQVAADRLFEDPVVGVGKHVAEIAAQRVELARDGEQHGVGSPVAKPVRRAPRQDAHQRFGKPVRVVRRHAAGAPRGVGHSRERLAARGHRRHASAPLAVSWRRLEALPRSPVFARCR